GDVAARRAGGRGRPARRPADPRPRERRRPPLPCGGGAGGGARTPLGRPPARPHPAPGTRRELTAVVLTRIEIDGFKTCKDFTLDVPPFLSVIGPNAVGKSNLFDALQFLRDVTDRGFTVAVQSARGGLEDLFRRRGD